MLGVFRAATCRRSLWLLRSSLDGVSKSYLSSSSPTLERRSKIWNSPRWVNPKNGPNSHLKVESEQPDDEDPKDPALEDSEDERSSQPSSPSSSSSSSSSSTSSSSSSSSAEPPQSSDASQPPAPPPESPPASHGSIAKQSIPDVYPQVLALPIARRPLFPGFYKAVVIRNPEVVAAVKEMMKRGQPYIGAFLLKEDIDSDVITDINSVHSVGVFAQITSVFTSATGKDDEKDQGLTAVLYPHRRIKITSLVKAGNAKVEPPEGYTHQLETPPSSPQSDHPEVRSRMILFIFPQIPPF
jgi:ATP-dependent Lon protease